MPTSRQSRIERRAGVVGGEPVIAGSRVSVAAVVARFRDYGTVDATAATFAGILVEGVQAALAYYENNQAEIDRILAEDEEANEPYHD